MTRFLLIAAFLVFGAGASLDARAQGQTPAAFVQDLGNDALSHLAGDKSLSDDEANARFRSMLQRGFDIKTIGRFAMGPYWRTANDAQKAEYEHLFENLIVETYAKRFREYSGQGFKVGDDRSVSDKDNLVDSQILQAGGPPINVQWTVRKEPEGLKIVDVAVEGVSMSRTQQSEFTSVIDQNGGKVDSLIDAMKNRQIGVAGAK